MSNSLFHGNHPPYRAAAFEDPQSSGAVVPEVQGGGGRLEWEGKTTTLLCGQR